MLTWVFQIFAAALRRPSNPSLPPTSDWLADLSPARYRPMLRLLDERDWLFLRTQWGYRPAIEQGLRRQRMLLFRVYLEIMDTDFCRLCAGLTEDRAARRQAQFGWRLLAIHVKLALYAKGIGRVDPLPLIDLLEETLADFDAPLVSA
jgi:hypothetical protein